MFLSNVKVEFYCEFWDVLYKVKFTTQVNATFEALFLTRLYAQKKDTVAVN